MTAVQIGAAPQWDRRNFKGDIFWVVGGCEASGAAMDECLRKRRTGEDVVGKVGGRGEGGVGVAVI